MDKYIGMNKVNAKVAKNRQVVKKNKDGSALKTFLLQSAVSAAVAAMLFAAKFIGGGFSVAAQKVREAVCFDAVSCIRVLLSNDWPTVVKIRISPFTFVFAAVMTALGSGYVIMGYFVAVVMHEMAHAEVAKRRGYALDKIRIMPYGASLTGRFEGITPRDEIAVALSGPLCNVVIAVLTVAVWWLVPQSFFFTQNFAFANIFTALTNLLPVFPLDGGRALLGALSIKMPRQKAYKAVRVFGCVVCAVFTVLAVFACIYGINPTFALMAAFVFSSTFIPDKNSKYQRLYSMAFRSEKLKHGLAVREIMVADFLTLFDLSKMLNGSYYSRFCVVNSRMEQVATVTETQLENYLTAYSAQTKLSQLHL